MRKKVSSDSAENGGTKSPAGKIEAITTARGQPRIPLALERFRRSERSSLTAEKNAVPPSFYVFHDFSPSAFNVIKLGPFPARQAGRHRETHPTQ